MFVSSFPSSPSPGRPCAHRQFHSITGSSVTATVSSKHALLLTVSAHARSYTPSGLDLPRSTILNRLCHRPTFFWSVQRCRALSHETNHVHRIAISNGFERRRIPFVHVSWARLFIGFDKIESSPRSIVVLRRVSNYYRSASIRRLISGFFSRNFIPTRNSRYRREINRAVTTWWSRRRHRETSRKLSRILLSSYLRSETSLKFEPSNWLGNTVGRHEIF